MIEFSLKKVNDFHKQKLPVALIATLRKINFQVEKFINIFRSFTRRQVVNYLPAYAKYKAGENENLKFKRVSLRKPN